MATVRVSGCDEPEETDDADALPRIGGEVDAFEPVVAPSVTRMP